VRSGAGRTALALAFALLGAAPLRAEGGSALALAAGVFEPGDSTYQAAELGLQWRGGGRLWVLHPMVGGILTHKGSYDLYAGFSFDLPLGKRVVLRPSFAPGYYNMGSGKDLGYALEFRSGLEAAWRFSNGARLGVEINHISNGGLGDHNPGANSLLLMVTIPIGKVR
jgi:lipid A 3-O-deacylase